MRINQMQDQDTIHIPAQQITKIRTKEEINNLIIQWKASKLSRSEFSRRQGLCIQTFCHWVKQHKGNLKIKSPLSFIPLKASKPNHYSETQYVEIKFANGLQCRFSMNSDIKQIVHMTKELINVIND